jgi:hypothetical protein
MANTIRHLVFDVRGLLSWKDSKLKNVFVDEKGKKLTAQQAREYLYDKLAEGYEVIPFGDECEGFDKKKGCPGHVKEVVNG